MLIEICIIIYNAALLKFGPLSSPILTYVLLQYL